MTIVLSPLSEEILSVQHWSTGRVVGVTSETLDADLERMLRSLVTVGDAFRSHVTPLLLEPKRYPQSVKVRPDRAEMLMNRMVPGLADRDEPVVVSAPPAEMKVVRRKGKPKAEELRPIAPVRGGHVAPVIADDVNRARVLATLHFWARDNDRQDLMIVGGWFDARSGEITSASAPHEVRQYVMECVSAGAPKPESQARDHRIDQAGNLITTPRHTRRSA